MVTLIQALTARIDTLAALPLGWNGFGNAKVSPSVADYAKTLLNIANSISKPPQSIIPTITGGLALTWSAGITVPVNTHLNFSANALAGKYILVIEGTAAANLTVTAVLIPTFTKQHNTSFYNSNTLANFLSQDPILTTSQGDYVLP